MVLYLMHGWVCVLMCLHAMIIFVCVCVCGLSKMF